MHPLGHWRTLCSIPSFPSTRRRFGFVMVFCWFTATLLAASARMPVSALRIVRFVDANSVEIGSGGHTTVLHKGERLGPWTLLDIVNATALHGSPYAILEDFEHQDGHLAFVDTKGITLDLSKSIESTTADPRSLYLGHTLDEVRNSAKDLLADEILATPGDPDYMEVAGCFPPIRKMKTYTFVGTHETIDKIGFEYGGRSPSFDPSPFNKQIEKIRDQGGVMDGLVGGWLPIVRFVYPEGDNKWTEMISFAPLHTENGNDRIQPAWYRVSKIENGSVKSVRYFDSYQPFPPRSNPNPELFYKDLLAMRAGWNRMLEPGMAIDVPDERVANMARHSLVRAMMTRVGDYPKYGVVDRNYAGSEHDGFPDTFTVETAAMLDWGLVDLAGRYIDNYFGKFVRDDGSILYRGPETGQYGRMLTVVAQYAEYGGDPDLLLKQRSRIDGVARLLIALRAKALQLPKDDPAYGMIAGWSEADSSIDPDPNRYMQPYFSNSTEAARGFRDLGRVWEAIGRKRNNPEILAWGEKLVRESDGLRRDLQTAIARSTINVDGETVLPAIAGATEPAHTVVARDPLDPQFRAYRSYMEMLYSGNLTSDQAQTIFDYRAHHHDTILGMPTAYGYNTGELAGFLSYGYGYGLIQNDRIRQALLMLYSDMAHQYTRGTWTAPETRSIIPDHDIAPYCSPAQLVMAMMTRWLLVFEDPESETLWLAKGVPQSWLKDGKSISVREAPTRWGRVGFSLDSNLSHGRILVRVNFPNSAFGATTYLRLRAPDGKKIRSVTLNRAPWSQFDPAGETVTIPRGYSGTVELIATME